MRFRKAREDLYPFGREKRQQEVDRKMRLADQKEHAERYSALPYVLKNSALEKGMHFWDRWASFNTAFRRVLPEGEKSLRAYIDIEKTLSDRSGKAVGLEFGGIGSAVFAEFTPHCFKKTAGIALSDIRNRMRSDPTMQDDERNHSVIEGNIFSEELYDDIADWLGKDKVDLIFEKMILGTKTVPIEPYAVGKVLSKWYAMLSDNGLMFVEIPSGLEPVFREWKTMIDTQYKDTIEVQYSEYPAFRLRKLPGAPAEMPLLPARSVRAISKQK
ncbi:MAG: hypothetical protein A2849_01500 [Candidatus Taylorbacteria bacterium RIFCSPHIGHO2_01_FULL_51_15]|uniref:Methyltransferase type 11 domain-containing protein n=1 Tax=Candidatus Taylorbacteria bacterium RIFCSPHIGHO2_01_FULL_51_15 TaxID=1802304 RepID=A0A1G2M8U3_9BACT|nr:MAG: hypothetical protein A2849_01500 [Candidatus Taylorbacteria bacterium RIFCSPHIGHO2_01_FULL_51_15]